MPPGLQPCSHDALPHLPLLPWLTTLPLLPWLTTLPLLPWLTNLPLLPWPTTLPLRVVCVWLRASVWMAVRI